MSNDERRVFAGDERLQRVGVPCEKISRAVAHEGLPVGDGRRALYHTGKDIGETKNLLETEPDIAKRLHAVLANWRTQVKAPMPTRKNGGAQ